MEHHFSPPLRRGLIFQLGVTAILAGGSFVCIWLGFEPRFGAYFGLLLALSLALIAPVPFILYRTYSLLQASYLLERDGLHLRWGLRVEDIPLPEVEWVRLADDLPFRLRLPLLNWPGAVVGVTRSEDLGVIEFMAAESSKMVLVATSRRVFVISPADPRAFERACQHIFEMGSLAPFRSYSARPAVYLQHIWADRVARLALALGLLFALLLLVFVGVVVPLRPNISIGFDAAGKPALPSPSDRLLILPVLGGLAYVVDAVVGMLFYRSIEYRLIAYFLWISSAVTPILLILAVLWML